MKNLKYLFTIIAFLTGVHAFTTRAAPTSTIVNYLQIKSVTSSILATDANGLVVATTTLSSGGGVATSSPASGFAVFTDSSTITGTSSLVTKLNNTTGSITVSIRSTSSPSVVTTVGQNIFLDLLKTVSGTQVSVGADGTVNLVNSGNWAGVWQNYNPADFLVSSTALVSAFNGSTGAVEGVNSINGATGTIIFASTTPINVVRSGKTLTISFTNPGFLTNASVTAQSPLAWSSTSTITCLTCLTTSTGLTVANFATSSISQWANDSGFAYGSQACGGTDKVSSLSATGTIICTEDGGGAGGGGGGVTTSSSPTANNVALFSAPSVITGESQFTYATGTDKLALNAVTSSVQIGSSSNFQAYTLGTYGGASSVTFSPSAVNATTSWEVPAGVTSLVINAQGAGGGEGAADYHSGAGGASVTGTVAVTPGQIIYICVGGRNNTGGASICGGGPADSGGNYGGGGMSWVSPSSSFATSSVWIGAGGGGGQGDNGKYGGKGAALGQNASSGTNGGGVGTGGGGGTLTAGGTAGTADTGGENGTAGAMLHGGRGGFNPGSQQGGGGGGGCFGGGGGGGGNSGPNGGSGGGGGSSCVGASVTATSSAGGANTASGTVKISYALATTTDSAIPALNSTTSVSLAIGGHIITGGRASSTVSSCGTTSGQGEIVAPKNTGNDVAGSFLTGTGTVNSCTINFVDSYVVDPICFFTVHSAAYGYYSSATTSSYTVAFSSSIPSTYVDYWCAQGTVN